MHTYLLLVMYKYCRFSCKDWKQWRESYKSLVLLGFLLTHGPEDFAEEFQCDTDVIQELGTFNHIDEKGYLLKSIGFFFPGKMYKHGTAPYACFYFYFL